MSPWPKKSRRSQHYRVYKKLQVREEKYLYLGRNGNFFRGCPPARYGSRRQKSIPVQHHHKETHFTRPRQFQNIQRAKPRPLFHEPRLPPNAEEALDLFHTLPDDNLKGLGLELDLSIAQDKAKAPVGGRLNYFQGNWERITGDPWILDVGAKVEFRATIQGGVPSARESAHVGRAIEQTLTQEVREWKENWP